MICVLGEATTTVDSAMDVLTAIPVVISTLALIVAWLSYRNSRQARLDAFPNVSVTIDHEAYDLRHLDRDGKGVICLFFKIGLSNSGGRPMTLRAIQEDGVLPFATGLHNARHHSDDLRVTFCRVEDGFRSLIENPTYPQDLVQLRSEDLRTINIVIPSGELVFVSLLMQVRNDQRIINGLLTNFQLAFADRTAFRIQRAMDFTSETELVYRRMPDGEAEAEVLRE